MSESRKEYCELSLISVPKMRRIYDHFTKNPLVSEAIINEVDMFFKFNKMSRISLVECLQSKIQV